jgi:DNA polymerase-3 subunit delta'
MFTVTMVGLVVATSVESEVGSDITVTVKSKSGDSDGVGDRLWVAVAVVDKAEIWPASLHPAKKVAAVRNKFAITSFNTSSALRFIQARHDSIEQGGCLIILAVRQACGKINVCMNSQNFRVNVIGHDWAIELLQRQCGAGRMPQALLLAGPRNVGKSTLARYLAQYLNCQGTDKPCGVCRSCRKVVSGNHPDVRIVDEEQETIKIDLIRQLQHELALSPVEGIYRVVVLAGFERATASAANALLKTLEEPASQVVIILTTPDPGGLLPTIVSRCQIVTLRPLLLETVTHVLCDQCQIARERAEILAQLSAGRVGWALQAAIDKTFLEWRDRQLDDFRDLLQMHRAERLAYAKTLSGDVTSLREALTLWLTIWRDLLLLKSGSSTAVMNLDWEPALQHLAQHSTLLEVSGIVNRLQAALLNLDRNVNPRLILEVLLLKLPQLPVTW